MGEFLPWREDNAGSGATPLWSLAGDPHGGGILPTQAQANVEIPATVAGPFRLHVQNGDEAGTHRILSATVTLNGTVVVAPWDFYTLDLEPPGLGVDPVLALDRTVTLRSRNTLQVRFLGFPGSFLVLSVYGTIPPPTLRALDPPTLPVTQGGTGSLTATLSVAQPDPTIITLDSTNPGIASVPATVTVPPGSVAVPVPVTAVAPGTATITVALNGSTLQSTVTVSPNGPTLTSLLPSALQVTQGATGTLTITLSAAQATDTLVPLASSHPSSVGLPPGDAATVPAGQLSQTFPVFGTSPATATITASLNGTTVQSQVTVVTPLPTVVSLLPPSLPLTEGSGGTLTVTLNASQPTATEAFLTTGDASIVGLPADRVVVPAHTLSASFQIIGLSRGMATVTASVNGSSVTSAVTVSPPPPMLEGILCPATLTVGATGVCTVTLTATQLADTVVPLSTNDPGVTAVPSSVTVPANAVSASFSVTALGQGVAAIAGGPLNGTSQSVTIQVLPPPPLIASLLPPTGALYVGATATVTLTLNAAQLTDTVVSLNVGPTGILTAPTSITVPAGSLSTPVTVTGLIPGTATLFAGPLNGTSAQSSLTVNQLPPTVTVLAPTTLSLPKGRLGTLTLTIAPTQPEATVVALASTDPTTVEAPPSVTVPAGASAVPIPLLTRNVGTATITAGPLNGTTQYAAVTVTPAELVSLTVTPPAPTIAKGQSQAFSLTGTYTDGTTQDLTSIAVWTSSDTLIATVTSGGVATGHAVGQATLTATVGTVITSATLTVTPPVLASIAILPDNPTKTIGRTLQFTATGTYSDGISQTLTPAVTWASSNPAIATITSPGGLAAVLAEGTAIITAIHAEGVTASTTLSATILPPDPGSVAPPVSPGVATALAPATEFLYTGADPVQTGVAAGAIEPQRVAVLRGAVLTRDGSPLAGVTISILNHPEYGTTLSRTDGLFDLAVNGGSQLIVQYQKAGYSPAQRPITPAWQDYAWLPEVVLVPYDTRVTTIDLTAAAPIQVARGTSVADGDGTRQATLFFLQGTTATMQLSGGATQPLTTLNVRATEYTVGPNGPQAMPGPLPTTTAYTYCAALTLDEALSAGATRVQFSQPVITYVENFVGFPIGGIVPLGYYDPATAAWVPSDNGRVVKMLSITGGLADLDISGSGTAATPSALAALGVTDAERQQLAALYAPGQSLWRMPIPHFSAWDANWGWGPPLGATFWDGDVSPTDACPPCLRAETGSIIHPQTQTLGEAVGLVGTPFQLHYVSDRLPGRTTARTLEIPATSATLPPGVKRVEMEILVAGQRHTATLPAQPNQTYTFVWDGHDGYGRALYGAHQAVVRVGYVYDGAYTQPAALSKAFGYNGNGRIAALRTRQELTLWQEAKTTVGTVGDARAHGLGGWTLDVHHAYDPGGQVLRLGDGTRRSASDVGTVITTVATGTWWAATFDGPGNLFYAAGHQIKKRTPAGVVTVVAGTGPAGFSGDGGPAVNAQLNSPYGMSVDGQGTLFFADYSNHRIRKVTPDGIITTVAGDGSCCGPGGGGGNFKGDGGPATAAGLELPWGVTVDGQGSLLIADTGNSRIRKVTPDGIIRTIAGGGGPCFTSLIGDGGPATAACLYWPAKVAIDAQGNLFIPDHVNNRVRKVTPEGIISTVAGIGYSGYEAGFSGDGGPAIAAKLDRPLAVAVDARGNVFIPDYNNHRIRMVNPQGTITTIAGNGTAGFSGDGGPATSAQLNYPREALLDPQGILHIADGTNGRIRKIAPALPGFSTGDLTIPSADGAELYVFSSAGRHLRTHHALTGAIRSTFGYDAEGRLASVTDGDSNVTTIARDGTGAPTAIVAPDGQRTTLTVDANGYLATLSNPAGETHRFTYTGDGLLQTLTTPRNHSYHFTYDALGRLTRDEDPATGVKTLDRTGMGNTYTVTLATSLNRTSTFHAEPLATGGTRQVDTEPDGTQTEVRSGADAIRTTTTADGTVTTLTRGPDPRFGMQAPISKTLTVRLPSGLTSNLAMTRAVTLSNPTNPLSLTSQTETITLNGRAATSTYTASTKTRTDRSPANRVVTTTLDAQGRVVREQVDSLEPVAFTYDPRGRLSNVTQGTGGTARTSTLRLQPRGLSGDHHRSAESDRAVHLRSGRPSAHADPPGFAGDPDDVRREWQRRLHHPAEPARAHVRVHPDRSGGVRTPHPISASGPSRRPTPTTRTGSSPRSPAPMARRSRWTTSRPVEGSPRSRRPTGARPPSPTIRLRAISPQSPAPAV